MGLEREIEQWKMGGEEDFEAAQSNVREGFPRHGMFFAHLALEKLLKAIVLKATGDIPKIHDLLRLARLAKLELSEDMAFFFGEMQEYCLAGR